MAKRNPATQWWMGLGCGCCGLIVLVIGGVMAAGFFGVSAVKDYVEDMKDPAARAIKARELLGAPELPEGYLAQFYIRIPWVFDLVVLSDGEPAVMEGDSMELREENFGDRAFVFFTVRQGKMDEADIDDMLQGRRTDDGVEVDVGLEIDAAEELASGAFDVGPQQVKYKAYRGRFSLESTPAPGIFSRVLFDCKGDTLTRAAVWFLRAPEAEDSEAMLDLAGSPADEAALRQFLDHFNVCAN